MKVELYTASQIAKIYIEVTKRFNIFLYFDYNHENFIWKIGPEFLCLDDLYSFSISFINSGIVFGYDRELCSCVSCGKDLKEDKK